MNWSVVCEFLEYLYGEEDKNSTLPNILVWKREWEFAERVFGEIPLND